MTGKNFAIKLKHQLNTLEELSLIYTPGVGYSSKEIAENEYLTDVLTNRKNSLAVIFDCQNDEKKYLYIAQIISGLIKKITNIDAFPLVSSNYDINKIIENLEPSFKNFYVFSDNIISFDCVNRKLDDIKFSEILDDIEKIKKIFLTTISDSVSYDDSSFKGEALNLRLKLNGVIETEDIYRDKSIEDIKLKLEQAMKNNIVDYENKTIAIISDGSAVLGLGNIGAYAAIPVMEGKAAIFKAQADVDAIPICLKTQNIQEIIDISAALAESFAGVNLEDINAPRCFEVEKKLTDKTNIPIFHDDQHGTAIIVLAALLGALELANKKIEIAKIVMSGAGAAAQAVAKLLIKAGAKNIIMRDIKGVISKNIIRDDEYLNKIALVTNPNNETGTLAEILKGADVLIGLSAANIVSANMIKSMNKNPIVFVLANPTPEIMPNLAKQAGAFIVATGRSDFENQINNSLAFPGIFKGLLEKHITKVTDEIKYNAAIAIKNYSAKNLSIHTILPKALDKKIVDEITKTL